MQISVSSQNAEKVGLIQTLCLLRSGPVRCFPYWKKSLLLSTGVDKPSTVRAFVLNSPLWKAQQWLFTGSPRASSLSFQRGWEFGFTRADDRDNIWRSPNSAKKPLAAKRGCPHRVSLMHLWSTLGKHLPFARGLSCWVTGSPQHTQSPSITHTQKV